MSQKNTKTTTEKNMRLQMLLYKLLPDNGVDV